MKRLTWFSGKTDVTEVLSWSSVFLLHWWGKMIGHGSSRQLILRQSKIGLGMVVIKEKL